MLSCKDLYVLSNMDYKACIKFEEDFSETYAVYGAAIHIQQAVQKSLQGLILIHGETPLFTHDIRKLSVQCEKLNIPLPDELDSVADTLTLWEIQCKYDPCAVYLFSEKLYKVAKSVFEKLNRDLSNELDNIKEI